MIVLIAAGALFSCVGAWWMGSALMAPAPHVVGPPPDDLPIEVVTIKSESGSSLAGWFVQAQQSRGVVVLMHPIRGSRLSMLNRARIFHDAGFSVLLFDFQAHGESPGEHITVGCLERLDAQAAVAYARERCAGKPIVVDGASLGGAAALLASPLGIDALILESVYPTIDEAVRNRIALRVPVLNGLLSEMLLMQLKPRLGFDRSALHPIDRMDDIGCPVLVMIGGTDPLTTPAEAKRMFDAAHDPKVLCGFEGAGHVDLCERSPEQFRATVLAFLERALSAAEPF